MTTLTPFELTPLGLFHTVVSLIAVALAILAIGREQGVSPATLIGRAYLVSLFVTTVTGLPIFRHGTIRPPHVLGVLTLVALAVAAAAGWTRIFGRRTVQVRTFCPVPDDPDRDGDSDPGAARPSLGRESRGRHPAGAEQPPDRDVRDRGDHSAQKAARGACPRSGP